MSFSAETGINQLGCVAYLLGAFGIGMFNHKLSSIPNQNYRLDAHPTIDQLTEMIEKARGMSGVRHNYLWELPKEFKKYTLSLHCKEKSYEETDIEWWLHEENIVGTKMHWFHKTKDIAVIYPHLLASIGEKPPGYVETEAEKLARENKEKNVTLGARLKKSTTSADLNLPPDIDPQEVTASHEAEQQSTMRLMSGNLKTRPIAWLLQTAAQSELTGELKIEGPNGKVIVQFGLGRPVHAVTANLVGTEAILDLFAWTDGTATFVEGKQPETASVQDSSEEILKQGSKMLESLGFLARHGMNGDSILSRPPIGLNEEQLEQRLKDGFDYGFKMQRSYYRALDGQLTLRQVGAKIGLDASRLFAITVNFLKLGLILTPDGQSLRQVAVAANTEAFATAQAVATQALGQQPGALKPPPGFFGGGGFGTGDMTKPVTGETPKPVMKPTSENAAPPMPPASVFGGGMGDTSSGVFKVSPEPAQEAPKPAPEAPKPAPEALKPTSEAPKPITESPTPSVAEVSAQEQSGKLAALARPAAQPTAPAAGPAAISDKSTFEVGVPHGLVALDENSVKAVADSLCSRQTGAFSSPAFQYFLEREFARAFRFSSEFSLLVFCMRLGGEGEDPNSKSSIMTIEQLSIVTQTVCQIKRDVDMFGHIGDRGFGLILPGVGTNQSMALVDRIVAELPKLAPKLGGKWPICHFGIAGVPQDARDLPALMDAAQQAMLQAADKNYTRIRFSELE